MTKIEEVKEATRDLKSLLNQPEISMKTCNKKIKHLESAINALVDKPAPIDLSDLRVGDELLTHRNGWGEYTTISNLPFPIGIKHPNGVTSWVTKEGKVAPTDQYPEVIAVRKKKRMVKKTRRVFINEHAHQGDEGRNIIFAYDTEEKARKEAGITATRIAVPYDMEYTEYEVVPE
jgi:hypothetical protein